MSFRCGGAYRHDSRDKDTMTTLIVSFVVLGSLLCLLVSADEQPTDAVEAVRIRSSDQ